MRIAPHCVGQEQVVISRLRVELVRVSICHLRVENPAVVEQAVPARGEKYRKLLRR
jgi:hypothetical protein